jgi:predicted nicotinamide N-methyase
LRSELKALERRFVLEPEDVRLGDKVVRIERPRSVEDLIDEDDFARDERLPYWAELWPSARLLARLLATGPGVAGTPSTIRATTRTPDAPPRTVLELGCGVGLVTIAAMMAGYHVTATDYYADARRFTERNAILALGRAPATRHVDWRALPDDLGQFDLVLAADVLYELPYAELVAEAVHRALAPGGRVWLADQGRVACGAFLEHAAARGLSHRVLHREVPKDGTVAPTVTVYELRREGA